MKISSKLFLLIMIFVIISVIIISVSYYFISKQVIENRIQAHLNSVAVLKEKALNYFFEDVVSHIGLISESEVIKQNLIEYGGSGRDENKEKIRNVFNNNLELDDGFYEYFIIGLDGEVIVSSDENQEEKIKLNDIYFIEGKKEIFIQSFYYDFSLNGKAVTISSPIKDNNGNLIGVLVGRVNLRLISDIMKERAGLGETGESYLVNRFNFLVSKSELVEGIEYKKAIYNSAVTDCLNGNNGYGNYYDYRDILVSGTYRWVSDRDVCLVVELDVREAFEPIRKLSYYIILLSMGLIFMILIVAKFLSGRLTKSVSVLRDTAKKIGKGNFDIKTKINSRDEIGDLAKTINIMAADLKKYQSKLLEGEKKKGKVLEKEVNYKTNELNQKVEDLNKTKAAILNMMDDMGMANDELKRLDKSKSEFLNIVSHELKTPLTAILAYLDILEDPKAKLNENQVKGFNAIRRNSHLLKGLINNILEISRIEAGKFELVNSEFDAVDKIKKIIDNLKILSKNKGIELGLNGVIGKLKIVSDGQRFEEILNNLISNAIKFTDKGRVSVGITRAGDFVKIYVSDTGVGIPKDKMKNLFQKFYQVDASISRKHGGTGLGLAITKQLIELQGGDIRVESEEGKGTKFEFKLPIKSNVKQVKGGK